MGKEKKKGKIGTAATYINRTQAIKKLQVSLSDFRKLCILKGIYPHEPKHRHKLDKGKGIKQPSVYYLLKDIQFILHEPLIEKFRDFKIFANRLKKLRAKKEYLKADATLFQKPKFFYDHIIKERYPNFEDALGDMDDCLTLCNLFSKLPKSKLVHSELIIICKRLIVEFMNYVIITKALRKVFLSIKGIYYQVEILGHPITWISPYDFNLQSNNDVDFKIMTTFTDFYVSLLGFVNYKLYTDHNLMYPPKFVKTFPIDSIDKEILLYGPGEDGIIERLASFNEDFIKLNQDIGSLNIDKENDEIERELLEELPEYEEDKDKLAEIFNSDLFKNFKFFLNREVPRESLAFVVRCFGGQVSWAEDVGIGSLYPETDDTVTHQIVDRPTKYASTQKYILNRHYVQPQWVYDCVNAQKILDVQPYFASAKELPPHVSPFYSAHSLVGEPISKDELERMLREDDEGIQIDEEDTDMISGDKKKKKKKKDVKADEAKSIKKQKIMRSEPGKKLEVNAEKVEAKEQLKLRELMLSKKYKRLYHKMSKVEMYREKEQKRLITKKRKMLKEKK